MKIEYDEESNTIHVGETWIGPHPNLSGVEIQSKLAQVTSLLSKGFHVRIRPTYLVVGVIELDKLAFDESGVSYEIEHVVRPTYKAGGRHLALAIGEKALEEISKRLLRAQPRQHYGPSSISPVIAYRMWIGNERVVLPMIWDDTLEKTAVFLITAVLPEEKKADDEKI